jgi:hypothetical protein
MHDEDRGEQSRDEHTRPLSLEDCSPDGERPRQADEDPREQGSARQQDQALVAAKSHTLTDEERHDGEPGKGDRGPPPGNGPVTAIARSQRCHDREAEPSRTRPR